LSEEVATALSDGVAVVALESTIFSNLGLPSPANAEALARCTGAVRERGAIPALTAVLDGVARVGLDATEHDRILGSARKAAGSAASATDSKARTRKRRSGLHLVFWSGI
jgi:pseudouridine-5'-phosphate glycosidase